MISIDYDPKVLTYEDLLTIFWSAHRCDQINTSRQYMNAVFYHDETQKKAAEKSLAAAAAKQRVKRSDVGTTILPVGKFTYAEDYHQKYYLTQFPEIRALLVKTYKSEKELADSTVATRLNAYLGNGMKRDWKVFLKEIPEYGLAKEWETALTEVGEKMLAKEARK